MCAGGAAGGEHSGVLVLALCPEYIVILKDLSPNSGCLTTLYGHHTPKTSSCPAGEGVFCFVHLPASLGERFQCTVSPVLDSCRV